MSTKSRPSQISPPPSIPPEALGSPDTLSLGRYLLGKRLVVRQKDGWSAHLIYEVEAYDGPTDRASHAWRGLTARNRIMFGPAAHWYVYLVYGIHEMLNVVTGPENYPAALLLRSAGNWQGPGRLTKALGIDRSYNGLPMDPRSGLYIAHGSIEPPAQEVLQTARVGVDYAGPDWSKRPYRFIWKMKKDEL